MVMTYLPRVVFYLMIYQTTYQCTKLHFFNRSTGGVKIWVDPTDLLNLNVLKDLSWS